MPSKTVQTKRFLGLNNVSDPLRLKFGWLQSADNMDITDTGALVRRDGYAQAFVGTLTSAYSTADFSRLYVVDAGSLKQITANMGAVTLRTGLSTAPMQWAEVNDQVFYTNGVDSGIIAQDGELRDWAWAEPDEPDLRATNGSLPAGTYRVVCTFLLPDGRETGASDAASRELDGTESLQIKGIPQVAGLKTQVYIAPADSTVFQLARSTSRTSVTWNQSPDQLGVDLNTQFLDPLPSGCSYIAAWRGRLYAAQYMQAENTTVVWASEPLGFHLFNRSSGFIMVNGKVTMLAPHPDGLVIGTDANVFVYDGETLKNVAPYGVVPGWGWAQDDDGQILFWSERGLCSALPFSNITLRQISVDCGVSAGAAIIQKNGAKRFVVALNRGGENFNQRGS